jgi:hypothetical protein
VAAALRAQALQLLLQRRAGGLGGLGAGGLERGEALLELPAGLLGLGQRGGEARLGAGGGLGALGLEALQAGDELPAGGVVEPGLGVLGVEARALQALEPGEQLEALALGLRVGGRGAAARGAEALQLEAGVLSRALGGLGAVAGVLRLALDLLHLGGEAAGDALELVDALQRGEQAGDDGGRVVEVADRLAADARVGVGELLLPLGVLAGAVLLAAGQLLRHPRGGSERAERHHRAGGAPAVPGLRLRVEGGAQRAYHDGVLLAHAQQHQVHRELEGEVLEEEGEVEPLVELDGHEDRLDGEGLAGRGVLAGDLDERAGVRRVAGGEEAAPLLGVLGERAGEQALEERVPQRVRRLLAEQQLGGLAPLRDGALAVGQDEPTADDLLEQAVERIQARLDLSRVRRGGRRRVGGRCGWRSEGAGRRSGRREVHAGTGGGNG